MLVEASALSALPAIRHAFFTRQGGTSGGIYASLNGGLGSDDNQDHIRENRRRMAEKLSVPDQNLLSLYQIHSATVITAEGPWAGERPRADAMVTNVSGVALGIGTADCGPVLFADADNRVVGAAHAGWKGAIGGVLEATVDAMEKLGAERRKIVAVLGPTISQANYEVGAEFKTQFCVSNTENSRYFIPSSKPEYFMFDLPAYIASRMAKAGVNAFFDSALCTYGDETRFYSYRRTTHRREADYGRQISAICLG